MPKYTARNKYFGIFALSVEAEMEKLEELYSEPIQEDDHEVIKTQKKMFSACKNETAIAKDAFHTIKEILRAVGGWPVAKDDWNESTFDWIQTTYKLRQLGYTYSSFLKLDIVPDPKKADKYNFKVSLPDIEEYYSRWFDSDEKANFMTDVAVMFGAQTHVLAQMSETNQFLQELQWQTDDVDDTKYRRYTIAEFQEREASINWLEFINRIAGPQARITKNDVVIFPPEEQLDDWFGLLTRTPKNIQANYMLWKVVEDALPYLTEELRRSGVKPRFMGTTNVQIETRSEICINEIRKRFSPNPMDIMYMRKYLPEQKREKVAELVNNMKTELLAVVKESKWMHSEDRQRALDRLDELVVVVGAPGNYFDDAILDNLRSELNKINNNNFLSMLSQANRDNLDRLYGLFNKSTTETSIVWKDFISNFIEYDVDANELNIPAGMVQGPVYNDKRPNYLNYANMGIILKYFFLSVLGKNYDWSSQSEEAFDRKRLCLIHGTNTEKTPIPDHMVDGLIAHILGLKVSYAAYKNWAKNHEEPLLTPIDYTPEQLFWISSANIFCEYTMPLFTVQLDPKTAEAYSSMVSKVININPTLARDFECPAKYANKSIKNNCEIF